MASRAAMPGGGGGQLRLEDLPMNVEGQMRAARRLWGSHSLPVLRVLALNPSPSSPLKPQARRPADIILSYIHL